MCVVVGVAQRTMSGHHYEDIGPPASFNQLPQPEGDWAERHAKKQAKYNGILLASAAFFAATFAFVSIGGVFTWLKAAGKSADTNCLMFMFLSFGFVLDEAIGDSVLQRLCTRHLRINGIIAFGGH